MRDKTMQPLGPLQADLEAVFDGLQSEGLQFVSRPCRQPLGQIMVNFTDPDGNVLTLQ
tara:strand:+ start:672 stop:845 length:174 start_codon:yes stop_codon:yes gene_type:complete